MLMKQQPDSVYANPVYTEICPFLVLGIILLYRENNGKIDCILLRSKSEENMGASEFVSQWIMFSSDFEPNKMDSIFPLFSRDSKMIPKTMNGQISG